MSQYVKIPSDVIIFDGENFAIRKDFLESITKNDQDAPSAAGFSFAIDNSVSYGGSVFHLPETPCRILKAVAHSPQQCVRLSDLANEITFGDEDTIKNAARNVLTPALRNSQTGFRMKVRGGCLMLVCDE